MRVLKNSTVANMMAAVIAIGATLALPGAATAQQASDATVAAGLQVWRTGGCGLCHGTFGNGEKTQDEMPTGANLRTTKIDGPTMAETIKCGRPGVGMPYFDPNAYTKDACYGLPLGPVPEGSRPPNANLTAEQIQQVVAYVQTKLQGHPTISKADCAYYYGLDPADPACASFK